MAGTGTGAGPGRDLPGSPLTPRGEVERMAAIIAADVARLEEDTIDAVLPALLEAREELRRGLAEWLGRANGATRFSAQELRRGLVSVEAALEAIGAMRADLQEQLLAAIDVGAELALGHLREELARFGARFGHTIRPTQISTAALIARAKHEIIPRIRTSSHRYVQAVREDMRRQLAIGLVKGETFTQMTNRLRRLGGPRGLVALRGVVGEPGAYVEEIAEGLFKRYRHWAERIVRTEVINAYNVEHIAAIDEHNQDADEDDQLYLKWDSSTDRRVCATCRSLDGRVTKVGKPFRPGIDQPPAHPNCRCVAVAWHPSWGGIEGEFKPTSSVAGVKLPKVSKPPRPRKPSAPRTELGKSIGATARDDMGAARVHLDNMLRKSGLAPQPTTTPTAKTTVAKLPAGVLGQHRSLTGEITLAPQVAKDAQAFAQEASKDLKGVRAKLRALEAARRKTGNLDPAGHEEALKLERLAQGFHVLVHESLHGFGPLMAGHYQGVNAKAEEVLTEVAARVFMRERFGSTARPPRGLGAYEEEVQRTVDAIRSHFKVTARAAMKLLELAADDYKRIPKPSSLATALTPTEHLARILAQRKPAADPEANKPRRSLVRSDGTLGTEHEHKILGVLLRKLGRTK